MHIGALEVLYRPLTHAMHAVALALLWRPGVHMSQLAAPCWLYVPAGHPLHQDAGDGHPESVIVSPPVALPVALHLERTTQLCSQGINPIGQMATGHSETGTHEPPTATRLVLPQEPHMTLAALYRPAAQG